MTKYCRMLNLYWTLNYIIYGSLISHLDNISIMLQVFKCYDGGDRNKVRNKKIKISRATHNFLQYKRTSNYRVSEEVMSCVL